jgi:ketosteroid isomerase-like protein
MNMENSMVWHSEIQAREEALRVAFLGADISALQEILADGYIVNSPLQKVIEKSLLLELLRSGRIRHLSYEIEIEHIIRYGDVVVVMGHDRVTDPPDGVLSNRRFTNVWQQQSGTWRSIARHAHVLSKDNATTSG